MKRLLATDLDGTLIGDDEALRSLWRALRRTDVIVAFSTGRHLPSIEEFCAADLGGDCADACVCMVGTEIYQRGPGGYVQDEAWHAHISDHWDADAVLRLTTGVAGLEPQPAEWRSPWKISFFVDPDAGADAAAELERRLADADIRAKVIHSADRYLDVLPARAGKGEAVRFLAERLDVAPAQVITCGDTGNDLDMMRPELGFRCVIVGNATPELAAHAGPHVYRAAAECAGGVREGLEHYGWL